MASYGFYVGLTRITIAPKPNARPAATSKCSDKKGLILGATIVGAAAGEQITAWTLAINHGFNIRVFAELVVPYPTFTEIGKRAAITFFTPRLTSPWMRRFVKLLRRFG